MACHQQRPYACYLCHLFITYDNEYYDGKFISYRKPDVIKEIKYQYKIYTPHQFQSYINLISFL